jgi:hypothetical protein
MVVGVTVIVIVISRGRGRGLSVAVIVVSMIAVRVIGAVIVAVIVRWVHGSVRLAAKSSTRVFGAFSTQCSI